MPALVCIIHDVRKIDSETKKAIETQVNNTMPNNFQRKTVANQGWESEIVEMYFRIKAENRAEKDIANQKRNKILP